MVACGFNCLHMSLRLYKTSLEQKTKVFKTHCLKEKNGQSSQISLEWIDLEHHDHILLTIEPMVVLLVQGQGTTVPVDMTVRDDPSHHVLAEQLEVRKYSVLPDEERPSREP